MDMPWEWLRISIWSSSPLDVGKLAVTSVRARWLTKLSSPARVTIPELQGLILHLDAWWKRERKAAWEKSCLQFKITQSCPRGQVFVLATYSNFLCRDGANHLNRVCSQMAPRWCLLSSGCLPLRCGLTGGSDKCSCSSANRGELCFEHMLHSAKHTEENRLATSPHSFQK